MQDLTLILDGTTVADGTLSGGIVEDWQAAPSADAVDRSSPILAANPRFFDLLTSAGGATILVGRAHATYRAAFNFELTHRAAIGLVGAVSFGFTEDAVAWLASYTGVAITPLAVERTGVFTRTSYTLEFAGAPTITEDAEAVSTSIFTAQTIAPSSAGNATIALTALNQFSSLLIQPTAGAGAYTYKIVLPTTGRALGHRVEVRLEMPASVNPSIEFRNATDSGTNLLSATLPFSAIAGQAGAAVYELSFVFNGTAWRLQSYRNES